MPFRMKRRGWVVLAGLLLILAAAGGYLLLRSDDATPSELGSSGQHESDESLEPSEASLAAEELASSTAEATTKVDIRSPKGISAREGFKGRGSVDFASDQALITYDLGHLMNPAGGFGQLTTFDAAYMDSGVAIEIFPEGESFLAFDPSEAMFRDIGRLREVILASPLILPSLLSELEGTGSSFEGSVEIADVESSSPAAEMILGALEAIETKSVDLGVQFSSEGDAEFDYVITFPVALGAKDVIRVGIETVLTQGEVNMEVPSESEIREL